MGGFGEKGKYSFCFLIVMTFVITLIVVCFSPFDEEIKVVNNRERIGILCDKYSVNKIYDEKAFKRFENALGVTLEHEIALEINDKNEIKDVLEKAGLYFNDNDKIAFLYLKKHKFLSYYLNNQKIDECKREDCFISENKVYDLSSKRIVYHVKDIKIGYGRYDSCLNLGIGAFARTI